MPASSLGGAGEDLCNNAAHSPSGRLLSRFIWYRFKAGADASLTGHPRHMQDRWRAKNSAISYFVVFALFIEVWIKNAYWITNAFRVIKRLSGLISDFGSVGL